MKYGKQRFTDLKIKKIYPNLVQSYWKIFSQYFTLNTPNNVKYENYDVNMEPRENFLKSILKNFIENIEIRGSSYGFFSSSIFLKE